MTRQISFLAMLVAGSASAQEMGLDLTDTTDYRPTCAVVGLAATDPQVPPDLGEKLKVDKVAAGLVAAAQKSDVCSSVLAPADVFGKISDTYGDALLCSDAPCFAKLAPQIDVNQLITGQLVKNAEGKVVLKLYGYTRYKHTLEITEVPANRGPPLFERDTLAAFQTQIKKAAGTLGMIKVTSETPNAVALLNQDELGPVPFTKSVPPGNYVLKVQAEGFLTDDVEVAIVPSELKSVESNLVPKAPEAPPSASEPPVIVERPPEAPKGPAIWKRPGFFLALGGVAAIATGFAIGSGAKGLESKAVDGNSDGALDITRREANGAHRSATTANVLVGAGAAALAGGVVWIMMTPVPKAEPGPAEVAVAIGFSGELP
jgi:hypothetical protein